MRCACALLILTGVVTAAPLKTSVSGHTLVLQEVFLNGAGPYRMMVDTGNTSSIVRPGVARCLKLQPAYQVSHASIGGTRTVSVAIVAEVRTGLVTDPWVEFMVDEVNQEGVDGVLGQSWLIRHDYLLDYRARSLVLDGRAPDTGVRLPLRSADGRPIVVAAVDGRNTELVIDSGSSALVLFETPRTGTLSANLDSNTGSARGERCTVSVSLAESPARQVMAVRVAASGLGSGLLPASAFSSVFVSNRQGFVQLSR